MLCYWDADRFRPDSCPETCCVVYLTGPVRGNRSFRRVVAGCPSVGLRSEMPAMLSSVLPRRNIGSSLRCPSTIANFLLCSNLNDPIQQPSLPHVDAIP